MATVKSYSPGQVKPNPLPASRYSTNATAESFGGANAALLGQMGKGLQQTGSELSSTATKWMVEEQDQKDKAVARDALNGARTESLPLMSSIYEKKGKDAIDAFDQAQKGLTKIREGYSKSLTPRQREYFIASYDGTMEDHLSRAATFQLQARENYRRDTLAAENLTAIDEAVAARTDPEAIRKSMRTIAANTLALARGQEDVVKKQAVQDAMDNLHSKVLSAITQDSPVAAQAYFKANKQYFKPTAREQMQKELDEKAFEFTVRMKAVELSQSGMSLENQLAEADKLKDPKMADALAKRVREKYADKVLAKKAQDAEVLQAEWQKLQTDPRGYQIPYEKFSDKKEWQAMEAYKKAKLNGFALASDTGVIMRYGLMDDQALRAVPVNEIAATAKDLTEKDWKEVFGRYQALRGGKGAAEVTAGMTQIRTDATLLTDTLHSVGIKTDKGQNAETVDKLFRVYQSELSQEELKLGRKLTPPEKQQVVDDLFVKGKVGWFSSKRVFEVAPKDWKSLKVSYDDIPEKDKVQITEALNAIKKPLTKENIEDFYKRRLESRRK